MGDPQATERAAQWDLQLPESYLQALELLGPEDEIGFWSLTEPRLDPSVLSPGGPINLFPVGNNGMGDYLCLHVPALAPRAECAVAMWNPEKRQQTRLGADFDEFRDKEMQSRIDFLLDRGAPLSKEAIDLLRAGQSVDFADREEDQQLLAGMLADACRTVLKLGLAETFLERAAGQEPATPREDKEIDPADQGAVESAIAELAERADAGDGGAAFEVLGFQQAAQNHEEVAKWAFKACRCLLFTWPDFSVGRLQAAVRYVKEHAAALPPADRIDPLFGFLTGQPPAKPSARMTLAKQYLRKNKAPAAVREAQNALFLAGLEEDTAEQAAAYGFLCDVFRSQNRPRELAYCELMQAKLP